MTTPELSVLICSRNGERTLGATLDHVRRQSLHPSRFEVVVVDDGSTDRTAELARARGARVVSLAPGRGLAAARNVGVRASAAALIAFTDDDCLPHPEWLATLAGALSDPAVDGVGGRVVPAGSGGLMLRYLRAHNPLTPLGPELMGSSDPRYRLRLYLRGVSRARPELPPGAPLYSVVGASMALRRELVMDVGGFDEAFTSAGEEQDLCMRAHARPQGATLRYVPGAVVEHVFEPGLGDALRRARGYGVAHARAARRHRGMHPILYPFPVMTVALSVLSAAGSSRRLAALSALAPIAAYSRWPRAAWESRSPEPMVYPYLQLAEEVATMVGELTELSRAWTFGRGLAPEGDGHERFSIHCAA